MSVTFYITPYPPDPWKEPEGEKPTSDLQIDPDEYRAKLIEQWPEATVYTLPSDSPCLLSWRLPPVGEICGLSGNLLRDQQIVAFNPAPKSSFIMFILWYRRFVPVSYKLFLFNSSSWDSLELKPDVTEQDIVDFTGIIA